MLLLATPVLLDPNFADTVVLMLDVGDEGALGVVLNRPTGLAVSEVLSDWGEVVAEPEVLFQGGPVETEGALAVALRSSTEGEAVGFREVAGPLGLLDLDTPVELVTGSLAGLRIFAGYAGWGSGQLRAGDRRRTLVRRARPRRGRLPQRLPRAVARRAAPPAGRPGHALHPPRRPGPQLDD